MRAFARSMIAGAVALILLPAVPRVAAADVVEGGTLTIPAGAHARVRTLKRDCTPSCAAKNEKTPERVGRILLPAESGVRSA